MEKTLIIILLLSGLTALLPACATHYIPGECPVVGDPPVMSDVEWVMICIEGKDGVKVCHKAPKDDANLTKLKTNEKQKDIYITDCWEKVGEKPNK